MAKKLTASDIKILILDKNVKRQRDISTRLRVQKFNASQMSEGFYAINILEQGHKTFHIIMVNGDLEDMPGVEVCSLLRSIVPSKKKMAIFYFMDKGEEDPPHEIANLLKLGINSIEKETTNFNIVLQLIKEFINFTNH